MNTFEDMFRQGMSMDEIMNKVRTEVANAHATIKAEEEAKRIKAKQAAAEAKAKQEQTDKEARGKLLVDIANRALNGTLTAEDVSAIYMMYAKQTITKPADIKILAELLGPDSIDENIKMALATTHAFDPILKMLGADWGQVMDSVTEADKEEARKESNAQMNKNMENLNHAVKKMAMTDDQAIRSFLNSL